MKDLTHSALRALGAGIVDTIYPPRCAACRRRGVWVCADCDARLVRLAPPWCEGCGIPPDIAACRCDEMPRALVAHRAVATYDGWLRQAIIAYKYDEERTRADHLGDELAQIVQTVDTIDALVPVPLHPRRERERGFNQARLLARRVSYRSGIPSIDALIRHRSTPQQVGLTAPDRAVNVRGAFALASGMKISGIRVALVDDVCTTGSTLGACAEVLLAGGAREVVSLTLAREI